MDNSKWAVEINHEEDVTLIFSRLEKLREKINQEPAESTRPLMDRYEQLKDDSLSQLIIIRSNANSRSKVLGCMQSMLQSAITTIAICYKTIKDESEQHNTQLDIARSAHELYLTMATPPLEIVQTSTTYISKMKAQSSRLEAKCLRHQEVLAALQRTISACSDHKENAGTVMKLIHHRCEELAAAEEWETRHRELLEVYEREAARKLEEERNRTKEKQERQRKLLYDQLMTTP